jgi:hypothetical protein
VGEAEAMSAGGGSKATTIAPQSTQRTQRNFFLKAKCMIITIQEKDFGLFAANVQIL